MEESMAAILLGLVFACETKTEDTSSTDTSETTDTSDTSDTSTDTDDTADDVVGGPCEYDDYLGKCTVEDDLSVTFTGNIQGEDVYLVGNTASGYSAGDSVDCTISYITQGTCTPCILSIGECGSEAFAYIQNLE
jgi:hypothetical protein